MRGQRGALARTYAAWRRKNQGPRATHTRVHAVEEEDSGEVEWELIDDPTTAKHTAAAAAAAGGSSGSGGPPATGGPGPRRLVRLTLRKGTGPTVGELSALPSGPPPQPLGPSTFHPPPWSPPTPPPGPSPPHPTPLLWDNIGPTIDESFLSLPRASPPSPATLSLPLSSSKRDGGGG